MMEQLQTIDMNLAFIAITSACLGGLVGLCIPRKPSKRLRKRVSFWTYYGD